LETKANQQKLLGENISKYLQTFHVDHFTTLDDFSNKPPVHNGAQRCTRNGPHRRHRLSWHHATTHTTTATLLNGFLEAGGDHLGTPMGGT
jgi:hypothetical protein